MCQGGLEEERKAIFRVLGEMEKTGWNIKLARILKKVLSVVTLYSQYTRALTFENIWSRHFCSSGRGSGTERSFYTA
jgi:hypothetical protein